MNLFDDGDYSYNGEMSSYEERRFNRFNSSLQMIKANSDHVSSLDGDGI